MKKTIFLAAAILLAAAGCNNSQPTASTNSAGTNLSSQTQTQASVSAPALKPVTIELNSRTSSSFGSYLAAANGLTLYTDTQDRVGKSTCAGLCATNWPPYTVSSAANVAAAVGISGKVGTITRSDGSTQLTYKGMPLYFWSQDLKPGDATGNGVGNFVVAKP